MSCKCVLFNGKKFQTKKKHISFTCDQRPHENLQELMGIYGNLSEIIFNNTIFLCFFKCVILNDGT